MQTNNIMEKKESKEFAECLQSLCLRKSWGSAEHLRWWQVSSQGWAPGPHALCCPLVTGASQGSNHSHLTSLCFSSLICQMGVSFFQLIVLLWDLIKFKLHQNPKRQMQMSNELTFEGGTFTQPQLSQTFGTHYELVWTKTEQGKRNRWRHALLTYLSS